MHIRTSEYSNRVFHVHRDQLQLISISLELTEIKQCKKYDTWIINLNYRPRLKIRDAIEN